MPSRVGLSAIGLLMLAAVTATAAEPVSRIPGLEFVPEDSGCLVVLNVDNLLASRRFNLEALRILGAYWFRNNFLDAVPDVKSWPITEVSQVLVAMPGPGALQGFVVIRGKVNAKMLAELMGRQNASTPVEVREGLVEVFRRASGAGKISALDLFQLDLAMDLWFAALDDQTLVISLRNKGDVIRAARIREGKVKPSLNVKMQALVEKIDVKQDVLSGFVLGNSVPANVLALLPFDIRQALEQVDHAMVQVRYGAKNQLLAECHGKLPAGAGLVIRTAGYYLQMAATQALQARAAYAALVLFMGDQIPVETQLAGEAVKQISNFLGGLRIDQKEKVVRVQASMDSVDPRDLLNLLMRLKPLAEVIKKP